MTVKSEKADKKLARMSAKLPIFVNRAIEKALKPMVHLQEKLNETKAAVNKLQDQGPLVEEVGLATITIGGPIVSLLAKSPPKYPTLPRALGKIPMEEDSEETNENALEEDNYLDMQKKLHKFGLQRRSVDGQRVQDSH
ncbi:hypothetical protein HAX54_041269 [Datura stramonium]|uniref:Uncharacterized protein n=1 Tax=Datura stramonium TaxID=4076 RepID=A0ABS8VQ92_DATST|nr:hypothetical protein [Datura stramonium]